MDDTEDAGRTTRAPEQIETARLRLVRPRPADAREMFERYAADPHVTRYVGWPRHRTLQDPDAFIAFRGSHDPWLEDRTGKSHRSGG